MSSAVAEIPASSPLVQKLSSLDRAQRLRLGLGVAILVVAGIVALVLSRQTEYRVLYANLTEKDGGAVIAQLSQMNVPYKYTEGGGALLVPADRVYDVRLRLASLGLPKGSVTGFELMESNRFGMTQFQERLTFQRGLEGELTRSIQALSSVSSARVHLALPNQNGFFREQQKPSASVLVSLHGGQTLDRTQLAGIIHLVASSVPEMSPSAVTVLDDTGKLLSQLPDGAGGAGAGGVDAEQLQYAQRLEQQYTQRIVDMLAPIVGRQNVKAQVTAEIDFSQTESTSEQHRPNLANDASAVRSQQIVETTNGSGNAGPSGIPGATSNQPPVASTAPVNGTPQALQAAGGASAAAAAAGVKRESVTNYEVDKTVRVVRGGSGAIKRLSAAVVVNHQTIVDDKGKPITKALTDQQIEQMTALVRESIGFNKERGDSVNLMNTPFMVEAAVVDDTPLWKQPQTLEMARSLAWPVGTVLLALLVLFGLIRPGFKAMNAPKVVPVEPGADGAGGAGGQLDALVADDAQRPALTGPDGVETLAPTEHQVRLDDARALARSNPVAVANIVKNWINGEDAA
ncbi:flagellar M-ring protein FliF [Rhodoferax koreense]|uniref:Flagellar M-ring protein n=1 Tax=Rhodoferax koreensis TaxID=1842727 RepID=A0A1P8K3A7_9BURK|nr:flagellar basal-body MS-ring/collar protein FliF [Rhodoferax koreense]APW40478.1 flagellar M-ring protein FliF [Rhodoferax koreense]